MCDKWEKEDKRIIVIHKVNGGVGSAVRAGIEKASAPFCVFADSDDWMKEKLVEELYTYMLKYNADGVRGGYTIYRDNQNTLDGIESLCIYSRGQINAILDTFYEKKGNIVDTWSNSRCSKMYKTGILKQILGLYNDSITIGEDLELNLLYLEEAQSIVLIPNNYN